MGEAQSQQTGQPACALAGAGTRPERESTRARERGAHAQRTSKRANERRPSGRRGLPTLLVGHLLEGIKVLCDQQQLGNAVRIDGLGGSDRVLEALADGRPLPGNPLPLQRLARSEAMA